jgi:hypothetical protein
MLQLTYVIEEELSLCIKARDGDYLSTYSNHFIRPSNTSPSIILLVRVQLDIRKDEPYHFTCNGCAPGRS